MLRFRRLLSSLGLVIVQGVLAAGAAAQADQIAYQGHQSLSARAVGARGCVSAARQHDGRLDHDGPDVANPRSVASCTVRVGSRRDCHRT